MNIAIVWDDFPPIEDIFTNHQAKLQAWRELANRGHYVTLFFRSQPVVDVKDGLFSYTSYLNPRELLDPLGSGMYDICICWGSIDRPSHGLFLRHRDSLPLPFLFQYAGGVTEGQELSLFSGIITQNHCDMVTFQNHLSVPVIQCFGVDKSFWTPDYLSEKHYETIYPASFCRHKGNEIVAKRYGRNALLCGKWIEDDLVKLCQSYQSLVLPETPHETLRSLYNASRKCSIGAWAGSQRTVAEAISCGLDIELLARNTKCEEILNGKIPLLDIPDMTTAYETLMEEVLNVSNTST